MTFEWVDPGSHGSGRGGDIGLIADEVAGVFPQWVGRDPQGYRTLTIGGFEALTAEALRELRAEKNAEISKLRTEKDAEIAGQEKKIAALTARLDRMEAMMASGVIWPATKAVTGLR